jgi:hypothetical protein
MLNFLVAARTTVPANPRIPPRGGSILIRDFHPTSRNLVALSYNCMTAHRQVLACA